MQSFLKSHEIKDISEYCKSKCITVIEEQKYNKENIEYYRGKYKGYLLGIKVCNHFLEQNKNVRLKFLYSHIKEQKRKASYYQKLA